ncbi:MAG TPA: hypothetical protein VFT74_20280, partial [Isosphaeraceae bacterium]|nr:hypothetical protein [Isosphaeraceae bacterium]
AGASVLSRVMIAGGREPAYEGRGFNFFPNAIIDQHFLRRSRLPRLRGLLTQHPNLLGFGVDEATALVLERGSGRLSVVGRSYVVALTAPTENHPERLEILKSGDSTSLADLRNSSTPISHTHLDDDLFGP